MNNSWPARRQKDTFPHPPQTAGPSRYTSTGTSRIPDYAEYQTDDLDKVERVDGEHFIV